MHQSKNNRPLTTRIISRMAKHQQQFDQERKHQETSFITSTGSDVAVPKITDRIRLSPEM